MKKVSDIMSKNVSVCRPTDTLSDAATIMKQKDVGVCPICDESGRIMGMVTDRDLVIRGYAERKPDSTSVDQVMSDHVTECTPDTSVEEASRLMAEHQIRRLPVIENGKMVGIVSLGDLSTEKMSDHAAGIALKDISERPEVH